MTTIATYPELKPCPFCGSDDLNPQADQMMPDKIWWAHVVCGKCDARGPGDGWADSKAEAHAMAIEVWNRRTLPEGMALVPQEITAETGHKTGMIGDFTDPSREDCPYCDHMGVRPDGESCEDCGGEGSCPSEHTVSWTTIKAIHRRIVELSEVRKP